MPQDIEFHVPFPHRVSSDLGRAQAHNINWLRGWRLVAPGEETVRYLSFALDLAAGMCHPQAAGAELELGVDQLSFARHFEDSVDGVLRLDPDACAAVCRRFAAAVAGGPVTGPRVPLLAAFLDLWSRSRAGMSRQWRGRAERDWTTYFMGFPATAAARRSGAPLTVERHLELRRRTALVRPVLNLTERLSRYEIPAPVLADDLTRRMVVIAEDVVTLISDVQTVEADEAAGEALINILLLLGRSLGCSRAAAIAIVQTMVSDLTAEFGRLRESLPELAGRLGLPGTDRHHLDLFVADGLCAVMRGTYIWGNAARPEATRLHHRRPWAT